MNPSFYRKEGESFNIIALIDFYYFFNTITTKTYLTFVLIFLICEYVGQ